MPGLGTAAIPSTGGGGSGGNVVITGPLGQQLAAASVPVVLTAAQLITLTPPAAITNYALETGGNLASAVTALQLIDNAVSGAGFNITQFAGVGAVTGSGTATGALRVELPTNGTGTITANAGTNLNTSALLTTAAHDAAFGTAGSADAQVRSIQGIASMIPVQVSQATGTNLHIVIDSGTISLPTGASTLAEQQTQTTALQLIDNIVSGAGVNITQMNGVNVSMGVGATGTGVQRVVQANDMGKTLVSTGGSASSSGNNTLVAAGTNRLKVYAFSLSTVSTTAVTCIFQSGAGGTELWRVKLQTPANVAGGANLVVQPPAWLFATASATLLNLNLSGAIAVDWSLSYFDEA